MSISNFSKQKLSKVLTSCPYCGSNEIIKHGTCSHHQRYLCKCCHKTFVSTFDSMIYKAKLKSYKIKLIGKSFLSKMTLRQMAFVFNGNKNTALLWRKKFLLEDYKKSRNTILFNKVEIDEKYVNISKSKYLKTNTGLKFRGLSIYKLAIAIGLDNHNNHIYSIIDRGHPSSYNQLMFWKDRIKEGSTLNK